MSSENVNGVASCTKPCILADFSCHAFYHHSYTEKCNPKQGVQKTSNNIYSKFPVRLHGEYNILVKLCGNTT